jgi:hypothetical protein
MTTQEATSGVFGYYPEMGDAKPEADIEAQLSYSGKHYFLSTPLELKGRGVTFVKKFRPEELTPKGQRKAGWNEYRVTMAAFDRISKAYRVSRENLLD